MISNGYFWLAWCLTAGFAIYDVKTRRVPDRALFVFCAYAFWAPFLRYPGISGGTEAAWAFGSSLMGAAAGFLLLLYF